MSSTPEELKRDELLIKTIISIWGMTPPKDVFESPDYKMTYADARLVANNFADALLDKLMPTEEEVKEHIIDRYGKAYSEFEDGLIQGDENGCEWFRSRMEGESK